MRIIDNLLNRVTMYRLVLYYLIALIGIAVVLSFAHVLAYDPYALLFSTAFILAVCSATNFVFSRVIGVPANVESSAISGPHPRADHLAHQRVRRPVVPVLGFRAVDGFEVHHQPPRQAHLQSGRLWRGVDLPHHQPVRLLVDWQPDPAAVCAGRRAAGDAQAPPLQARLELYGRRGGCHLPGRAVRRPGARPGASAPCSSTRRSSSLPLSC